MRHISNITNKILEGASIRESLLNDSTNMMEASAGELRDKILAMGLDPTGKSVDDMQKVLAAAIWAQEHPGEEFPDEYEAVLAQSKAVATRDWVNKNFKDTDWWIQIKQDGMRSLMEMKDGHIRMTSRNRSAQNHMFIPHEDKVLGFQNLKIPFKGKTVLDGELMSPTKSIPTLSGTNTTTKLQAVVALTNMPQKDSFEIQQKVGSLYYVVYDILWFDGENVQDLPYEEREPLCSAAVNAIKELNPEAPIQALSTIKVYDDPWDIFQKAVADNEEGLMFKKRDFKYQQGKRVAGLQKLKAFNTVDGFITDFIKPTKGGRGEKWIGGLLVSAYVNGKIKEIANISGLSDADKQKMTEYDSEGNPILKKEFYNRCLQMVGNNWSRNGKLVHPRLDDWREDKSPEQCQLTSDDIVGADR